MSDSMFAATDGSGSAGDRPAPERSLKQASFA
jgi:hypothetical protein